MDVEPPFEPFGSLAPTTAVADDGLKRGFLAELFRPTPLPQAPAKRPAGRPAPYSAPADLVEIQLLLPEGFLVRSVLAEEFLISLYNLRYPIAFELVGIPQGVIVQFCCEELDYPELLRALQSFFPDCGLRTVSGLLQDEWFAREGSQAIVDFGLSECFFEPLGHFDRPDADPLIAVVGALADGGESELSVLQVLLHSAKAPWGETAIHALTAIGDAGALGSARTKFSAPLIAAKVSVASVCTTEAEALRRVRHIGSALIAGTRGERNCLIALSNEGYAGGDHAADILRRRSRRQGMLLSLPEAAGLAHLPSASVRSRELLRKSDRTKAAPEYMMGQSFVLGVNEHEGIEREVGLSVDQRLRHTYLIGASGTGKSTLLLSMILQDLKQGRGVAVLDPHGDLVDDVLRHLPDHREEDVILLDPSDEKYPVGLNILSAPSELEKVLLSSDLVGVFRRLSTSWGDQMTSVLGNAVLAFLESTEGGTLLELRRFLVDAEYRKGFLTTVKDSEVVYFWQKEFPLLKGIPQAPLLTRLDTFLRPKLIRNMVRQKSDRLNFRRLMDQKRILLARLSQGAIGEENGYLLGSLLVSKIGQAAMSRQQQEREARVPFFLYIDEFHNFVTPSISTILEGARKYGLGLTLAHQGWRQLKSRSEDVASSVLANAYTRIVFRVGDQDARTLAEGFSFFEADVLQSLGTGRAIVRAGASSADFNLETIAPAAIPNEEGQERADRVRTLSRAKYGTAVSDIEQQSETVVPTPAPKVASEPAPTAQSTKPQSVDALAHAEPVPVKAPPQVPTGRGGPQHKYLQALLKRAGEDRGFRGTTEKTVLDGAGHVDVALEKEGLSIGCEISVSTDAAHEIQNLAKCLAAGFDYAVLVCANKRTLSDAQKAMSAELSEGDESRARFLTPEAFMTFLDEVVAASKSTTETVRGYRVNLKYSAVSSDERQNRERILGEVISKSLRRKK